MANLDVEDVINQLEKTRVDNEDTELSFAGRGLKLNSEKDAEEVVVAIKNCPKMQTLQLEGNTLGVDAAKAIAKALEAHPELERALWKDMFTGRLKSEIPEALMFLSSGLMLAGVHLVELDLSDNAFGPIGIEGVTELIKSPTCYTLQVLRLNNNGLGISGGKLLAQSLLACHENSNKDKSPLQLKIFICGRNRLENAGAQAIAEVFKILGTLEEIQMPQNSVFYEGIEALAKGLQHNLNLTHLNLNDNIFTENGAKAVAAVLPKLQNLEIINFGDCLLKTEGAQLIASALKDAHLKLKELQLGFNEIHLEAAVAIVDSLRNKSQLIKLDLNGNQLGMGGCQNVKSMLAEIDKPDVLGSMSDDEGDEEAKEEDDEDDDDENYDDVDDDDEEVAENEKENVEEIKPVESKKISDAKSMGKTILTPVKSTPSEFLASPSSGRLLGMGNNRALVLLDQIRKDSRGVDKYIDTFIKVASVVESENEAIQQAAFECADSLLSKGFKESEETGAESIFANTFLVYLGLIKSEDKAVKPPTDASGALIVLEHAVRQPYFSRSTKEMLQLFLSSRFHEAIEQTGKIKHSLMQTLYQY